MSEDNKSGNKGYGLARTILDGFETVVDCAVDDSISKRMVGAEKRAQLLAQELVYGRYKRVVGKLLSKFVSEWREDFKNLRGELTELKTEWNTAREDLEATVENLRGETNGKINSLTDGFNRRLAEYDGKLASLTREVKKRFENYSKRLVTLRRSENATKKAVDTLQANINNCVTMDDLENEVETRLQSAFAPLSGEVREIKEDIIEEVRKDLSTEQERRVRKIVDEVLQIIPASKSKEQEELAEQLDVVECSATVVPEGWNEEEVLEVSEEKKEETAQDPSEFYEDLGEQGKQEED